ncbi:putative disease resistance protein RGA3 [Platanthera zijinensis]|uniref:Disease resistance protein RGA3 n=1 Tax=Platanthera zijinensis TaxID=2320716 RepID=A0AAP0B542_9ASPA
MREETGSFINESEVYGRKEDKENIVSLLLNCFTHGPEIGVVSIFGLGGLGKTTLAQFVYNDERVRDRFEKRMWVCVSDEFEIKRLIVLIMESATGSQFSSMNMDVMQVTLAEQLKEKRFLLVLDDVWNESQEKWERLRTLLAVGGEGSKILVTTRSERVASIMGTTSLYKLSNLSLNLVEIGRQIVKKCGGVPLAAKALGSLLRFKKTESDWIAIKDSELWKLSGDDNYEILPALKLSYDHLSSCLKQCFTYCSIFPKDYEIDVTMLVRLWDAEGFLKPSDGQMDTQQIGLQYVDELLERSLFQKSEDGGGVAREIKMHDLVHDLARSVAGDECSIVDPSSGNQTLSQNSRYSSFIFDEMSQSAALQSLHDAKKLRTLYMHKNILFIQNVNEVLQVISSNVNLLRALHLQYCPLKTLPDSFKKLKHLRYLDLSRTLLDSFPPCISTLHNLKDVLQNLQPHNNLKELKIQCYVGRSFPHWILSLSNLARLTLRCCKCEKLPALGQLPQLEYLHLIELPLIKQLGSDFYGGLDSFPVLKELELYDMAELEEWCNVGEEQFLPCLHTLSLVDCPKLKELPSDFPSVTTLTVNEDDKLLLSSLQNGAFPNLKEPGFLIVGQYEDQQRDKLCSVVRNPKVSWSGKSFDTNISKIR